MRKKNTRPDAPKERFVGVRFEQATYNKIEAAARAADLSVSEYIRRMVIKGKVVVCVYLSVIAILSRECRTEITALNIGIKSSMSFSLH